MEFVRIMVKNASQQQEEYTNCNRMLEAWDTTQQGGNEHPFGTKLAQRLDSPRVGRVDGHVHVADWRQPCDHE